MPIVGDVLAERYRIDGVLGAGGMASVYRATDLRLERQVAVKVLLPNLARDPSLAGRFDREARMLAAVGHPSVAAIFDVEPGDPESGREPFYVMELCNGGSLADRIEAAGAIDPAELVPVIEAVAAGLAELHRNGVLHRDVKPGNILFAGGRPKLADFGLAKSDGTTEATTLTAPGTMVGTLPYLAPELLGGESPTTATDVYALGATTFHGLTGRLPKPFDSLGQFVDARSTPAPAVSSVRPELGAFDSPVETALAIDPAVRPSPADFAAGLATALEGYRADAVASGPGNVGEAAGVVASAAADATVPVAEPTAPNPDLMETVVAAGAAASTASPTVVMPPGPTAPGPIAPARASAPAIASAASAGDVVPPAAAIKPRPAPRMRLGRTTAIALCAAILILVLALLALANAGGVGRPLSTQPFASPSASPSASPGPSPSPSPDPAGPALQALDAVTAAIDQARGGKDGLSGGDAHDLDVLATDVGTALRAADYATARQDAATLAERADKDTRNLDPDRRAAILNAIDNLQAAIPAG